MSTNEILTSPIINETPTGTGLPTAIFKMGDKTSTYSTTSATPSNVDSTNLALTIVIPENWSLLVWASGVFILTTTITAADVRLHDNIKGFIDSKKSTPSANSAIPWALNAIVRGDGTVHSISLQFASIDGINTVTIFNNSANYPTMNFLLLPCNDA